MNKQEGSAIISIIVGVVLVGALLAGIYLMHQRSRDVTSNTPIFSVEEDGRVGVDGQSTTTPEEDDADDDSETTTGVASTDTNEDSSGGGNLTTPSELAPTGPESSVIAAVALAAFVYSSYRYLISVRQIRSL